MIEFEKEQKVLTIGNIKIGGQPGENPNVCIGSVFYAGHSALLDEKTGKIDKKLVEQELNEFVDVCEKNSIPFIIDIVGSYEKPLYKECIYISDLVDCPFLVDGLNDSSRVPVMEKLAENGLLDRAILNSIDESTKDESLEKFKEIGVKNAVILTFGSRYVFPKQKLKFLRETLLPKANKAGIENCLIDTGVLDLPSISINANTSFMIKNEFGLPAGCAPANAVYAWKSVKQFGKEARISAITSASIYCIVSGSDFVLFGPIKFGKYIVPSVALIVSMNSYYRKRVLRKEIAENNPLYKIFRD